MSSDLPVRVLNAISATEAKLSERYSEAAPLRAAIATVPMIGSALDALLSTRGQNIAQKRLAATVEALKSEFARSRDTASSNVDREFLESEEFYDLVWRVFEKGQRTRDSERLSLYARLLHQSVHSRETRAGAEAALDLIGDLQPVEYQLAIVIYMRYDAREFDWLEVEFGLTEAERGMFQPHLINRLEGKGIVDRKFVIEDKSYYPHSGTSYNTLHTKYVLTHHFRTLLQRLQPERSGR